MIFIDMTAPLPPILPQKRNLSIQHSNLGTPYNWMHWVAHPT